MKLRVSDDCLGTFFLSVVCFVFAFVVGCIPYVGYVLAPAAALGLGFAVGWVLLGRFSQIIITLVTLFGFRVAFGLQPRGNNQTALAVLGVLLICFLWGFRHGIRHAKAKEERDGPPGGVPVSTLE